MLDGAGDTVMKTTLDPALMASQSGGQGEDHFQIVTAQRGQGWERGGTRVCGSPEEAPDSSWEVRRTSWRRRCELSSEGRARWVPGEGGIRGRGTACTEAQSEGKGGTFEEQNKRQQVRVGVEDGD